MDLQTEDIGIVFDALSDLEVRQNKDLLVGRVRRGRSDFQTTLSIAVSGRRPQNWHAAWIITSAMHPGDERVSGRAADIIDAIPGEEDGFQCELLRIVSQLELADQHEGRLFEVCLAIWEDIKKKPGVRMFAFRQLCRIIERHPELKPELGFVTEEHHLDSLSPGIKRSVRRLIGETLGRS